MDHKHDLHNIIIEKKFGFCDINPSQDLIFEERVKLLCFYCAKYGKKRTCPPLIPNLDWKQLVSEYENGMFVYHKTPFKYEITKESRRKSSMLLFNLLKELEDNLHDSGYPLAVCFGGGSCKICENTKTGSTIPCQHPTISRIPVEAMGVNLVDTLLKFDIQLPFPPESEYYRVGLLLW